MPSEVEVRGADMSMLLRCWSTQLAAAALVFLGLTVYWPGLGGGFVFDDYPNLVNNQYVHAQSLDYSALRQAALTGFSGLFGRPVSMLSFGLNHALMGLDPFYFKLTNLVIHAVNGVLIYVLTSLLLTALGQQTTRRAVPATAIRWVALATAGAWMLHPICLTSVLYVVQRMTSLAALFTLLGLIAYSWGRLCALQGRGGLVGIGVALLVCWPLAALSKENGALLPLYLFVIELTIFGFRSARRSLSLLLLGLFGLVLVLPLVGVLYALWAYPEFWLNGYQHRDFGLMERVLTQTRVLWFYVGLILLPANARLSLFHDDFPLSAGLLAPPLTVVALVGWVGVFAAALWLRKRAPVLSFGVLFFLAGHSMESTILPLEMVHEHRNYLPAYGLLVALIYYALLPYREARWWRLQRYGTVLFVALLAVTTAIRASVWGDPVLLSLMELERNPRSARIAYDAGVVYASLAEHAEGEARQRAVERGIALLERTVALDPNHAAAYASLIILASSQGRDLDPRWLSGLRQVLAEGRILASTPGAVESLLNCQMKGTCHLPEPYIDELIRGMLGNAHLQGRMAAIILTILSRYLWEYVQDYGSAFEFSRMAVQASPQQIPPRLNLVCALIRVQQFDLALQELQAIRQRDRLGAYRASTRELEAWIAELRSAALSGG